MPTSRWLLCRAAQPTRCRSSGSRLAATKGRARSTQAAQNILSSYGANGQHKYGCFLPPINARHVIKAFVQERSHGAGSGTHRRRWKSAVKTNTRLAGSGNACINPCLTISPRISSAGAVPERAPVQRSEIGPVQDPALDELPGRSRRDTMQRPKAPIVGCALLGKWR